MNLDIIFNIKLSNLFHHLFIFTILIATMKFVEVDSFFVKYYYNHVGVSW